MKSKPRVAIVGHGFVGKAVDYAFPDQNVDKVIIDPKYNNTIKDACPADVFFVCVPTPMGSNGSIDASILCDVVENIKKSCGGLIIIKSTVTPEIIDNLTSTNVVYNPEFLREATAVADIVTPSMHIFGGGYHDTRRAEKFFNDYSVCQSAPVYHMSSKDASFCKYTINSFLATKVLWFNQLYDIANKNGANFGRISKAVGADPRIGGSHMMVPGPDGKQGFGGACFPKDTAAFVKYAPEFSILEHVIRENNVYRIAYEKDDREKEQNISYE
jgi:UDPglucose 6-dehydrogenase